MWNVVLYLNPIEVGVMRYMNMNVGRWNGVYVGR